MSAIATLPAAHAPGPIALLPQTMDQAFVLAERMAHARLVPAHLQKSPADCLLVIEQAMRWRMSPFAVAQATSSIQGKLMFEGKLVAAALHTSGALSTRLDYRYSGEGDNRQVVVSGVLAGEEAPREVTITLREAATKNDMWKRQPDQQLAYHGARVWARRYAPEVILGVYAPEEMAPLVTTPAAPPHAGPTIDAPATAMEDPPEYKRSPEGWKAWAANIRREASEAQTIEALDDIEGDPDLALLRNVSTPAYEAVKVAISTRRTHLGMEAA